MIWLRHPILSSTPLMPPLRIPIIRITLSNAHWVRVAYLLRTIFC